MESLISAIDALFSCFLILIGLGIGFFVLIGLAIYARDKIDMFEEYVYCLMYGEDRMRQEYLASKYGLSQVSVARNLKTFTTWLREYYGEEINI